VYQLNSDPSRVKSMIILISSLSASSPSKYNPKSLGVENRIFVKRNEPIFQQKSCHGGRTPHNHEGHFQRLIIPAHASAASRNFQRKLSCNLLARGGCF
jgi:hypothetical protein